MSESVSLVPDQALSPGDVLLQTRNGQVDATVQTQINNIVNAITGRQEESQ